MIFSLFSGNSYTIDFVLNGKKDDPILISEKYLNEIPKFKQEIAFRERITIDHSQNHPNDTLHLHPIKHIPYTIFYSDLTPNPKHWYNEGYAYYHGISAVVCDSIAN